VALLQAAEGRACVIAVNKWDTVPVRNDKTLADYEADVRSQVRALPLLGWHAKTLLFCVCSRSDVADGVMSRLLRCRVAVSCWSFRRVWVARARELRRQGRQTDSCLLRPL
jgi:hypothetical protein